MSQLPRYESYKDSGVQWLGEIPSHWNVKQLKFAVTCNDEALGENTELDYEILYVDISSVSLTDGIKHKEELLFENSPSRARRVVKSGDVLVSTVRTYLKAITYVESAEGNLIASTGFAVLRPSENFDSKFIGYWIQSEGMVGNIVANSVGVSYPAINSTDLVRLPIVELPLSEQKFIADFLDKRLAQVDALIAKQETLLEKLAEQRVALISHAVTKGLNPDVEMKTSGVEWLGKVPKSWDIANLRYFISCNSGDALESSRILRDADEFNNIPVIGGNGFLGFTENSNYKKECIAVGRVGALCGNVHFINYESWINDNALLIKLISDKFNINYLVYLLKSRNLNELASKTAQPLLTGTQVKAEKVCIPLMSEQLEIVRYLDTNLETLDKLLETVNKTTQTLREYRSTLITQVVTGKIDVRNLKVN